MRSLRLGLLLLLSGVGCLLASAQKVQSTQYRIRPLDDIHVEVYNEPQINAVLPVLPDGRISFPYVGLVMVAGKTTTEVEAELTDLYKERLKLRDPKVSVTIVRFRPLRANATGMFTQPGRFDDFQPGDTILTLISRAGSVVVDRSDLKRATLVRGTSRESIPIDLDAMLNRNDLSQNYELEDNDTLTIPEDTRNRINVMGAVVQPGSYPHKEPMYLADILTAARGGIPNRTKFSEVMVIRKKPGIDDQLIRIRANYVNYLAKGDVAQNVLLQPGDLVFVPETKTPDYNQLNAIFNSLFVVDRLLTGGFLGFKLFGN